MARKKRSTRRKKRASSPFLTEIVAIALLAFAALLAFSLWRQAQGMGLFGLAVRRVFLAILGVQGSTAFVIILTVFSVRLLFFGAKSLPRKWETPCFMLFYLTL